LTPEYLRTAMKKWRRKTKGEPTWVN